MREKFSDRVGITKPNDVIQLNSMTKELRNLLWNSFSLYYINESGNTINRKRLDESYLKGFAFNLFMYFFKYPLDNLPDFEVEFLGILKEFFVKKDWYEIYNFLDFSLDCNDRTN